MPTPRPHQSYRSPEGGMEARSVPDPNAPAIRLPEALNLVALDRQGGWTHVREPGGNRYWVDSRLLVATQRQVDRRPPGWYAQLYRRTYGDAVAAPSASAPGIALGGFALVVAGMFTPWLRPPGQWLLSGTAMDVPVRALWNGTPAVGASGVPNFFESIWNGLTGVSIGFFAIILAALAALSLLGFLPSQVRTAAAITLVLMPSLVVTQISRQLSGTAQGLFSVIGPGVLLMAVGGALLGLAKSPRTRSSRARAPGPGPGAQTPGAQTPGAQTPGAQTPGGGR